MQVIAENLSEEEIAGLKEMFKMIDLDNSGHITLEELKRGLARVGANLKDSEIENLMQAVCKLLQSFSNHAMLKHSNLICWQSNKCRLISTTVAQ